MKQTVDRRELANIGRYLVVGVANTLFSYSVYAASLHIGLPYPIATLVSLLAGIASGFFLQGRVTFRARLAGRLPLFVGLWILLYLVTITMIQLLAEFGVSPYIGGLVAAVPVNAISYVALRRVVFAEHRWSHLQLTLVWCIALVAIARLHIVLTLEANWDEFLNLSMVYAHMHGSLREIFQTSFVHLFGWLEWVSANEVDQIIAARLLTLACVGLTSLAIFKTARRYTDWAASILAALAFNCFNYSLLYATDLRTDTLATTAMMTAIWLTSEPRFSAKWAVVAGVMVGIGGALTIKAIFFVPTIAILLLASTFKSRDYVRWSSLILVSAVAAIVTLAVTLALHARTFPSTASISTFLDRTSGSTLLTSQYSIVLNSLLPAVLDNVGFWLVVAIGLVAALRSPVHRWTAMALAAPLAVPLIYSEIYAYYYPFMLAPVSILAAFGYSAASPRWKSLLILLLMIGAVMTFFRYDRQNLMNQRRTLTLVHQLFPSPTPYFAHTPIVSSYPMEGFFMSRWGVRDYRREGLPVMADAISRSQPKFLVQTRQLLSVDILDPAKSEAANYGLLGADVSALRDNYRRYWGPLFLPGKRLAGTGAFDIAIAGTYRVAGTEPVLLDGKSALAGSAVDLQVGRHTLVSSRPIELRWDAPPPPADKPPENLFVGW